MPERLAASGIRELVVRGLFEEALSGLKVAIGQADTGLSNEILLQRGRVNSLRSAERSGTETGDDIERQRNRLRQALLALVDHAEAEAKPLHDVSGWDGFLSYRREDGAETARLLRSALAARHRRLFLDVEDLGGGQFGDQLLRIIEAAPVLVPVLSPNCLARWNQPDDWFCKEVLTAVRLGKRIIPIRMPGFVFPSDSGLPAALVQLGSLQSVIYSHLYFDATVEALTRYMG